MVANDECPVQAGISQGFPHNSPSRPVARVVWLVYSPIHSLGLETAQVTEMTHQGELDWVMWWWRDWLLLDYTWLNEGYTISQYSINSGPGIMWHEGWDIRWEVWWQEQAKFPTESVE